MNPTDEATTFTPKLEAQQEARKNTEQKRLAMRSAYREAKNTPVLIDLREFIDAQIQGCKDRAATTDNKVIEDRHLHMLLMASIIKEYIDNQTK